MVESSRELSLIHGPRRRWHGAERVVMGLCSGSDDAVKSRPNNTMKWDRERDFSDEGQLKIERAPSVDPAAQRIDLRRQGTAGR